MPIMIVPLSPLMFLRRAAKLYPKKIGVICGEWRFSYQQLSQRVARLSHYLSQIGVKKGEVVGFLSRNCHRLLEAYYGVIQVGAILLPLNIRLTAKDFLYILNHAEAKVLFLEPDFLPVIESVKNNLIGVKAFLLLGDPLRVDWLGPLTYDQGLEQANPDPFPEQLEDENEVAELFYTSGTTDRPKGVMLTHRNLYLHAVSVMLALQTQESDVQLHTIPLYHANGWGVTHTITGVGGTHVVLRRFDANTLLELVEREKVTTFNLVPTMATLLLQEACIENYDLSSLRLIHMGGSAVPMEMVKALEERFHCRCSCGYGLTETSPVLTISLTKSYLRETGEAHYRRLAMTGLELPGSEVRVVDKNGRDVLPDGRSVGEIITRSNVVMKGYWKQPEETAKVIREGWFHTGDMATIDPESYILIVDRLKDVIIRGGENISSIEVERALHAHPAVLECAVIAVPDSKWGEVPKAFVVLKEEHSCTAQDLRQHCGQFLAPYKVPASFEFVASLPKSGTGKILKKMLREPYWLNLEKRVH
jgi:fatty-acyl-CoA synthase